MKICLINSLFIPNRRGGAELVSYNIAKILQARGHEVMVICSGYEDVVEELEGFKIYRLSPSNIFSFIDINEKPFWQRAIWLLRDMFNLANAVKVERILKEEKPGLILSHNLKGLGYLTANVIKQSTILHAHTIHDVQLVEPSGLIIKGQEKKIENYGHKLYSMICARLFKPLDLIISPSLWLVKFYHDRGLFIKQRSVMINNPLPTLPPTAVKTFNYSYGYVGQIEAHKGIVELLEAFQEFRKTTPQAALLVVGAGSLLNKLQPEYQDKGVTFLGYVLQTELPIKFFNNISYLVMPTKCYENSPGNIFDSFANSTPVLASRIGGIEELINDGKNGFLFEAGDRQSILVAFNRTIQNMDYQSLVLSAYQSALPATPDAYIKSLSNTLGIEL